MPKRVISPLIYDGMLDYYLRIQLNKPTGSSYETSYYSKKDYSLEDVENIRNNLLEEYERKGWRGKRRPANNGYTSQYLKQQKIK